ncbi:ammonium transporter [Limosilactobacillus equigenerosi]|uniref:Ammonium transporter n=1 Tax=Limosilactobacillus equigenerosi DSM 18793 = JCM 14505 TaxID=1423742 RepID=A0A0R1UHY5_9LACO|nr:ammonium transporter [Limosilactobacillus equigenerosi]KRL93014.1 ammonium transporter [Limosilactobacillus equigenerosi DSM 18793 = JCM 14505]
MHNLSAGDTAFMMLSTAMVCLMTPGLAMFYGGLNRKRSVLYITMQSFIAMGVVTLIWIYGGFGLAFGKDQGGVIGRMSDYFALNHVGLVPNAVHAASIPFVLFFLFQLMFCVITVPLMSGAFAERINMKGYVWLLIIWTYLVYIPVCHWVWGGGFLQKLGFVDFAGGTVIHTTAGFAALASILVLGRRKLADLPMKPSNLMAAAVGTGLLWFGWFGFNAGGAYSAGSLAAKAIANTVVGLAAGMVVWMLYALAFRHKVDFVDVLTGSVAGLATITPCAGYINPNSAVLVGAAAGIVCNICVSILEKREVDDALGVWGVHGMGGFLGTLLIGLLADKTVNGIGAGWHQFLVQAGGVVFVAVYAFVVTVIIIKVLGKLTNIKPSQQQIEDGLDREMLNENAYDL